MLIIRPTQFRGGQTLKAFGHTGTFYYSDGLSMGWGDISQMTLGQYQYLYIDGHDIGGQTLDYIDLTVTPEDVKHQICLNRKILFQK